MQMKPTVDHLTTHVHLLSHFVALYVYACIYRVITLAIHFDMEKKTIKKCQRPVKNIGNKSVEFK